MKLLLFNPFFKLDSVFNYKLGDIIRKRTFLNILNYSKSVVVGQKYGPETLKKLTQSE